MKEALKLALEALELNNREWKATADSGDSGYWLAEEQDFYQQTEKAITAIKETLSQPEQEPVARVVEHGATVKLEWASADAAHNAKVGNLYTNPPQRTWVGLTDEEMRLIDPDGFEDNLPQMIQQALKEKNT